MASDIVILYENFADSGLFLSGYGSWVLPLSNAQSADPQEVAQSTDAQITSTRFRMDLGRQPNVDGIAIGPINASPGSTWQVRGYSDSGFSALEYDSTVQTVGGEVIDWSDTGAWLEWENPDFWTGVSDPLDELPLYLFVVLPITKNVQYWQVEIMDPANADGFIRFGRLLISRAFRPSVSYSEDNSLVPEPMTDVEESQGGLRVYFERGVRRSASYAFPSLTEAEMFSDVFRMGLRAGISRQVFVVPDPEDVQFAVRRSFLCTFTKAPPLRQLLVRRGTTVMDFEEVI